MGSTDGLTTKSPGAIRKVVCIEPWDGKTRLKFEDSSSIIASRFLASFIRNSDHVQFDPLEAEPARELLITSSAARHPNHLYLAQLGYVTRPKRDKREEYFLRAQVSAGRLGINQVFLPNDVVRDYFYFANRRRSGCQNQTLYDLLRVDARAKTTDLRLAAKVRLLELEAASASRDQMQSVERAFNLLAYPDVRSCYDALLVDPEAPALFPNSGFGSILVTGDVSPDRQTFFAKRILSFLPKHRERRFRALLRQVEFFDGYALYRDSRRKVEVMLDATILPLPFEPTWNQWRNLVGTKFGIDAMFMTNGKYEMRAGEWHLRIWETALPSRTHVSLPAEATAAMADAQRVHHRFGQYCDEIRQLLFRIEREPIERTDLMRLCDEAGLPLDFDVAQVSWRADYDRFYYTQLQKRARKMFLYREEFIFELEKAMVVEIPQQGHATYIFTRPADLNLWIRRYSKATREDIRNNRGNVAEQLGFIGRVNHGRNPRRWLRELRRHIAEPVDYCLAIEE